MAEIFVSAYTFSAECKSGDLELPLQEMRIVAYTKAFAERFGLPSPAPGTEPRGGLEAIEFAIEKGPQWAPRYFLNFYLYLDNSLPIKFPEEGVSGEKYILNSATHFFGRSQERWLKWPVKDRLYFSSRQGTYNRKANLATNNYIPGKQGAISDLYFVEFYRELLPGLAYIKLDSSPFTEILNQKKGDFDIWLQKEMEADYRSKTNIEINDFLKFHIPDLVFHKIKDWGMKARAANDKNF